MLNVAPVNVRVAAGMAYLDSVKPGWYKEINLGKLNIESPDQCILGQLFGGYTNGEEELGLSGSKTCDGVYVRQAMGFTTCIYCNEPLGPITNEWKKQIKLRLRRDRDHKRKRAKNIMEQLGYGGL